MTTAEQSGDGIIKNWASWASIKQSTIFNPWAHRWGRILSKGNFFRRQRHTRTELVLSRETQHSKIALPPLWQYRYRTYTISILFALNAQQLANVASDTVLHKYTWTVITIHSKSSIYRFRKHHYDIRKVYVTIHLIARDGKMSERQAKQLAIHSSSSPFPSECRPVVCSARRNSDRPIPSTYNLARPVSDILKYERFFVGDIIPSGSLLSVIRERSR